MKPFADRFFGKLLQTGDMPNSRFNYSATSIKMR